MKYGKVLTYKDLEEAKKLITLSLVITDQLTDKEIELVHRTIGAISDDINGMDTILEAKE